MAVRAVKVSSMTHRREGEQRDGRGLVICGVVRQAQMTGSRKARHNARDLEGRARHAGESYTPKAACWRQEFGGLKTEQVKRLKDLELENSRLRKAVSDLTLDKPPGETSKPRASPCLH